MAKRRLSRRPSRISQPRLDKYEVQAAADTLIRAGEIDADSNLKRAAKVELKKRQRAIVKVIKKKGTSLT